jgi:hypothetical protein
LSSRSDAHSGPEGAPIEVAVITDADRARALAAFMAKTGGALMLVDESC